METIIRNGISCVGILLGLVLCVFLIFRNRSRIRKIEDAYPFLESGDFEIKKAVKNYWNRNRNPLLCADVIIHVMLMGKCIIVVTYMLRQDRDDHNETITIQNEHGKVIEKICAWDIGQTDMTMIYLLDFARKAWMKAASEKNE